MQVQIYDKELRELSWVFGDDVERVREHVIEMFRALGEEIVMLDNYYNEVLKERQRAMIESQEEEPRRARALIRLDEREAEYGHTRCIKCRVA